ncbi:unnamed protein product [Lathyrus oleraceus]
MISRRSGPRTKNDLVGHVVRRNQEANPLEMSRLMNTLKEMEKLRSLYSDKKLISPRYGTLENFYDFPFVDFLKFKTLEDFVSYFRPMYPNLVRVFNCDIELHGKTPCSFVKGKVIKLTSAKIGDLLGTPNEGTWFHHDMLCN